MNKKIAIYPGTFDPFTNGHLDLVTRSLHTFDEVIIGVAPSLKKMPLFTTEERLAMIKESVSTCKKVSIEVFDGLLVEFVKSRKGTVIIRGLRAVSDFEYELQMALMNRRLNPGIETVFMMPNEEYTFLTATIVKEIASLGGPVGRLVPPPVEKALNNKYLKITGPEI